MTFQDGEGTHVNKIESYSFDGLVLEGTFDPATGEAKAKKMDTEKLTLNVNNVVSGGAASQLASGKRQLALVGLPLFDYMQHDLACCCLRIDNNRGARAAMTESAFQASQARKPTPTWSTE